MGPHGVVVAPPFFQCEVGPHQRREQGLVQKLIAKATIEALDEGVLRRRMIEDFLENQRRCARSGGSSTLRRVIKITNIVMAADMPSPAKRLRSFPVSHA
jgi:hypothetical protein